jgi:hypothetical protein
MRHYDDNVCTLLDPISHPRSVRCGGNGSDVRIRKMEITLVKPSVLHWTDIQVWSPNVSHASLNNDDNEIYYLPLDTGDKTSSKGSGWVFPVITGGKQFTPVWVDSGYWQPQTIQYTFSHPAYLEDTKANRPDIDETVVMNLDLGYSHTFDYDPYSFTTTYHGTETWAPFNTTRMTNIGDGHYDQSTWQMDNILGNKGSYTNDYHIYTKAKLCPPWDCPKPPVPTPGLPLLWSDPWSWSTNDFEVPTEGQTVTISASMWIVLDITPPKLGQLIINGKLTVKEDIVNPLNISLSVMSITLWGTFSINGTQGSPYNGDFQLEIYGFKGQSPPLTMIEGAFLSSKVIGVAGKLQAIGQSKVKSWVRLAETVTRGSEFLRLAEPVAWNVGDQITISPTGYFNSDGDTWDMEREPTQSPAAYFDVPKTYGMAEVRTIIGCLDSAPPSTIPTEVPTATPTTAVPTTVPSTSTPTTAVPTTVPTDEPSETPTTTDPTLTPSQSLIGRRQLHAVPKRTHHLTDVYGFETSAEQWGKNTKSEIVISLPGTLSPGSVGDTVHIQITSTEVVEGTIEKVSIHGNGNFVWSGSLAGGLFTLSYYDGAIVCNVESESRYYELRPMIEARTDDSIDTAYNVREVDGSFYNVYPPHSAYEELTEHAKTLVHKDAHKKSMTSTDTNKILDVAFLYTNHAEVQVGGVNAMNALIQMSVDMSNQAYENSNIDMRMRVVHKAPLVDASYTGLGFDGDLSRITNPFDGYMDEDVANRTAWGADAVVLFITDQRYCGLGYVGSSTSNAYSLVNYRCPQSVAHEVGHNVGSTHDRGAASGGFGSSNYNFGWCWDDTATTCKRTVMAYASCITPNGQTNCPRQFWFSSPDVTNGALGQTVGTAANDNARLHNEKMSAVTNWNEATVPGGMIDTLSVTEAPANVCTEVEISGWSLIPTGDTVANVTLNGTLYTL